jgi:16S rRNA (cytosine1402-N4)-methyltransferase
LAILLDMSTHVPVLAGDLVDLLDPQPGELAVDCTFGAGGHARLVAERVGESGTFVAIDRDPSVRELFDDFAADAPCETRLLTAPFAEALEELAADGIRADVVYLDLGLSSMQVDRRERGFSYSCDAPLDMRMDPEQDLDAAEIVNTWEERRLRGILREYGEERYAGSIARAIVRRRDREPLERTGELVDVITSAVPAPARFAGGHPAKRTFQALRIAVNAELDQVDRGLPAAWDLLAPGGRLGAISFHSLEDRRVKRFLVGKARGCTCPPDFPVCVCGGAAEARLLTRRAVAPSPDEVERNPRASSAHLRVAQRVEDSA